MLKKKQVILYMLDTKKILLSSPKSKKNILVVFKQKFFNHFQLTWDEDSSELCDKNLSAASVVILLLTVYIFIFFSRTTGPIPINLEQSILGI